MTVDCIHGCGLEGGAGGALRAGAWEPRGRGQVRGSAGLAWRVQLRRSELGSFQPWSPSWAPRPGPHVRDGTERVTTNLQRDAARQEVDFQLSDNDMWVLRERIAARKTRSEAPWRRLTAWTAAWLGCCRRVGRCFGQSLWERADCSVMHQRHAWNLAHIDSIAHNGNEDSR